MSVAHWKENVLYTLQLEVDQFLVTTTRYFNEIFMYFAIEIPRLHDFCVLSQGILKGVLLPGDSTCQTLSPQDRVTECKSVLIFFYSCKFCPSPTFFCCCC